MGIDNYILMIGSILVGLILFFAAQVYLTGSVDETEGYIAKGTAERIVSVLEKLTSEPSYVSYCFNISLSDLKIEQGYLTFRQGGKESFYPIPKEANNVDLKEIASVCFVHLANGEIYISEELPDCDMNTICTADECLENCPDCYGPNLICIGDGFCNPDIGENCLNSVDCICNASGSSPTCCPEDPYSDESGCVDDTRLNMSKGEECFCDNECNTTLTCNPTDTTFYGYNKACCEPGKSWNGTDCVFGGEVLIVALKSNMQTVYSPAQITQLENKIKAYQSALGSDGLGSIFLYLDEDETSDIIGSKVTNPSSSTNIDGILDQLIPKLNSSYLVIIGGYDRFIQPHVGYAYGKPYETDNYYGDFNPKDNVLDIPVGRFPDPNNGDLDVILNALDTSISLHNSGGLDLSDYIAPIMSCGGYDNRAWTSGRCFCSAVWGGSCSACGTCCGCISLAPLSGKDFVTILAHGPGPSSSDLLHGGCLNTNPFGVGGIDTSNAVWMSMSCGGGHLRLKSSTLGSIPMTFLKNNGAIYFGSTANNRGTLGAGCPVPGGDRLIGTLYALVANNFQVNTGTGVGNRVGDYYMAGKNSYWSVYGNREYIINCLYGDPTLKIKNMW